MIVAEIFPLHDVAGSQTFLLHFAAGSQISTAFCSGESCLHCILQRRDKSPLHYAAGSQTSLLHFATESQIFPLLDAAASQILLLHDAVGSKILRRMMQQGVNLAVGSQVKKRWKTP